MKKFAVLIVAMIVFYSVYYDLKVGTIPAVTHASEITTHDIQSSKPTIPNKIVKVVPGDTVLTVVEKLQNGPLTVSIEQVVSDFEKLNSGIKPEEIEIGQEYKFPFYINKVQ